MKAAKAKQQIRKDVAKALALAADPETEDVRVAFNQLETRLVQGAQALDILKAFEEHTIEWSARKRHDGSWGVDVVAASELGIALIETRGGDLIDAMAQAAQVLVGYAERDG